MPSTGAELHVAVAVLRDPQGRVLLTRRHPERHQGGLWEFPGGKVEAGETLAMALARELREELGVVLSAHQPLLEVRHDYGDRRVLLDVHEVLEFTGEPRACEGQPMRWVCPEDLTAYEFPKANAAIVQAVIGN
jgi:8-oxo-dGTP diphosphatase